MQEHNHNLTAVGGRICPKINGLYIGNDLDFLHQLTSFDPVHIKVAHCASGEKAIDHLRNSNYKPLILFVEFELEDKISGLVLHSVVSAMSEEPPLFVFLSTVDTPEVNINIKPLSYS